MYVWPNLTLSDLSEWCLLTLWGLVQSQGNHGKIKPVHIPQMDDLVKLLPVKRPESRWCNHRFNKMVILFIKDLVWEREALQKSILQKQFVLVLKMDVASRLKLCHVVASQNLNKNQKSGTRSHFNQLAIIRNVFLSLIGLFIR